MTEKKFKAATTQVNLPFNIAQLFREMAQQIPDEHLMGDGRDTGTPHVTVRWGVVDDDPAKLQSLVDKYFPFNIVLGKVSSFPPSKSSDGAVPLIVEAHSPMLPRVNKAVAEAVEHINSEHPYNPHATIAYVRPEVADQYVGNSFFEDKTFEAKTLTLSDRNGNQHDITVKK